MASALSPWTTRFTICGVEGESLGSAMFTARDSVSTPELLLTIADWHRSFVSYPAVVTVYSLAWFTVAEVRPSSLALAHDLALLNLITTHLACTKRSYVMEAAKKGYIAYTNCPAALTEVVPFGGW